MKRIIPSNMFLRASKKLFKKDAKQKQELIETLELLSRDTFNPILKTHKLKGELSDSWSCSLGYEFRILFKFIQYKGEEVIYLKTIGTHDEVY